MTYSIPDSSDKIRTRHRVLFWKGASEFYEISLHPVSPYRSTGKIQGIEDVRVYSHSTRGLIFLGTVVYENRIVQVIGKFPSLEVATEFYSPFGNCVEKNWVFFDDEHIVYSVSPFTLLNYEGDVVRVVENEYEKNFRGSTNYVRYDNAYYAVIHRVSGSRKYDHAIIRVSENFAIEISEMFSFENQPIEYCLGFCKDGDDAIFIYSTWDRTTKVLRAPWSKVVGDGEKGEGRIGC